MKKLKVAAIAAVCVAAGASVAAIAQEYKRPAAVAVQPKPGVIPGGKLNQNLGDMDYGVCRGIDPKCYHDWPRPEGWNKEWRVLLFTHTAGPRHANIGTAFAPDATLNPPLADNNVVQRELGKLLAANNIHMDYTENPATLAGSINSYHTVIFFSTSRDNLDDGAKTALRQYMRKGGGFVGVHNAFGTLYNWPYYEGLLGGANYFDHPGGSRVGDVVIVDKNDTSTKGLPARFTFKDEWYNLVPFPTHVRFLAVVDEKSIIDNPGRGAAPGPQAAAAPAAPVAVAADGAAPAAAGAPGAAPGGRGGRGGAGGGAPRLPTVVGDLPGHGSFHPMAWCQYYDGGKAWMTPMGHEGLTWTDPNFPGGKEFKQMLLNGIESTMGMKPFCQ